MKKGEIEIYETVSGTEIQVKLEQETVWLDTHCMAALFGVQRPAIVKHVSNIYKSKELSQESTCSILEQIAADGRNRRMNLYNLDMIISVGYRVNSKSATQFRQWATQRLKDYLVKGYAINEKRLKQKKREVEYLKTGIRILSRAVDEKIDRSGNAILSAFSKGLELLDDYDHEQLDSKGHTDKEAIYPESHHYLSLIEKMYSGFDSAVFAKPKDNSFESSINQIRQSFGGEDLYRTLEEKAATLLYLIVKNHSFVDGNKRIGAACFLYFLERNKMLQKKSGDPIVSNDALAALTLFIAFSKSDEMKIVKKTGHKHLK